MSFYFSYCIFSNFDSIECVLFELFQDCTNFVLQCQIKIQQIEFCIQLIVVQIQMHQNENLITNICRNINLTKWREKFLKTFFGEIQLLLKSTHM